MQRPRGESQRRVSSVGRAFFAAAILSLTLFVDDASALNAPAGWTVVDTNRALLKPEDPSAGELVELPIQGGDGSVEELLFTLLASGRKARLKESLPEGHVNLLFDDGHLGRGCVQVDETHATWWVVIAHPEAVSALDSDALLKRQMVGGDTPPPAPAELEWGVNEEIEVLDAGADGSQWAVGDPTDEMLWGGAVEVSGNAYEWNPTGESEKWAPSASLVGTWSGHYMRGMDKVRVNMRLDKTGRVRLESRTGYGQSVEEGTWGVQGGRLRIEPYGGRARVSVFERSGDQLRITIDGKRATLMRKR